MFYFSALIAVVGAVGYQYFVKRIPSTINPIVSILGMYVAVLVFTVAVLPIFPGINGMQKHIRQLSWVQVALAISVIMVELGFILMYRYGWQLSTANVVTGVFVNTLLVGIGLFILGEKINGYDLIGIILCIAGVALISYRS
jgi:drug/metabolite transporter (DMT)-like permease